MGLVKDLTVQVINAAELWINGHHAEPTDQADGTNEDEGGDITIYQHVGNGPH